MTKFCPECGFKQKDENNHFCSNCGFDFSKLESSDMDSNSSDDSSINVPISSDSEESIDSGQVGSGQLSSSSDDSVDSNQVSSDLDSSNVSDSIRSNSDSSTVSKPRSSVSKISYNSNNQRKSTNGNKINSSSNGFLSKLTFNKCFLAFALLLIIMVIGGMLVQTTEEPYSDNGLTSFMDSSGHYDLSDIFDESSYDNDYSEDYLGYENDDSNDILG